MVTSFLKIQIPRCRKKSFYRYLFTASLFLFFSSLANFVIVNYKDQTPTLLDRSHQMNDNLTLTPTQKYDEWVAEKSKTYQDTCTGWLEYKEWVDALFDLAPPAPECDVVENFRNLYNDTDYFVEGTLVLSKNEQHNPVHSLTRPTDRIQGRNIYFLKMWNDANRLRKLPPNLEMLLYANDKPRVRKDLGLPAFTISGEFPVGSGMPTRWTNYLPFPSHFYSLERPKDKDLASFESKRPVVFFRGRFSGNTWSRFKTHKHHWVETPRFKLALGTRNVADKDVLDIELTGFATAKEPLVTEITEMLLREYNITVGKYVKADAAQSRYVLGVSGNGWAGATTMRALLSGSCMLFVNDNSTDYENITRDLGEIYFPLLKKDRDFVLVGYDNIADTARKLNANPEKARQISEAGFQFAKKFLGMNCALDVLEMLAWRYYKYVSMGCPSAFSHVKLKEFPFQSY